jgi:hypothetical protein
MNMANKRGGDVTQINYASQGNVSTQSVQGVASTGPALIGSIGGVAMLAQIAGQLAEQDLEQGNAALAGYGGSDNAQADTNIAV